MSEVAELDRERSPVQPHGPVAKALLAVLRGYRNWISPLFPPSCRFFPSCSVYAMDAVTEYGALRGSWMAVRRLSRCGPWHPGGVDPVPPRRVNGSGADPHNAVEEGVHHDQVPHRPAEE